MNWLCKLRLHKWYVTKQYMMTCELECFRCGSTADAANDANVGIFRVRPPEALPNADSPQVPTEPLPAKPSESTGLEATLKLIYEIARTDEATGHDRRDQTITDALKAISEQTTRAYERGIKVHAEDNQHTGKNAYNRGHNNGAFVELQALKRDVENVKFAEYSGDEANSIWLGNIRRRIAKLNSGDTP